MRPAHGSRASFITYQSGASLTGNILLHQSVPGVTTAVQYLSCAHRYKYMRAVTTGGAKISGNCCCCSSRYEHICPCEEDRSAQAVFEICWRGFSFDTRTPGTIGTSTYIEQQQYVRYSGSFAVMQYSFEYQLQHCCTSRGHSWVVDYSYPKGVHAAIDTTRQDSRAPAT